MQEVDLVRWLESQHGPHALGDIPRSVLPPKPDGLPLPERERVRTLRQCLFDQGLAMLPDPLGPYLKAPHVVRVSDLLATIAKADSERATRIQSRIPKSMTR